MKPPRSISAPPLETLLVRPSDGGFCASGAHGRPCPLRAGSRNHRQPTHTSAFPTVSKASGGPFGSRVDHLADFGDLGRRKAADLGVLADHALILGEIDAEGLVVSDVALDPLDVGADLAQRVVG